MAERHAGEKLKGRLKEGAGDITGDRGLKREGKVDQGKAGVKNAVDEAGEKIKDTVNPDRPRTRTR